MHRADELAQSLLSEGYTAMKIWPFDPFAERTDGSLLSAQDLEVGLAPFRKIREAVGDRIEIMAEFHSLWNLDQAKRIARALEEYRPFWSEDPIKMSDVATLAEYARSTRIPVCASETLGGTAPFRDILQAQAADVIMLDVGWCGGLTEARKIAALAESYQRPVAPHDCNGPVVWVASIHFMLHIPNALVMEAVRAYFTHVVQGHPHRRAARGRRIHLRPARRGAGHAAAAGSAQAFRRAGEALGVVADSQNPPRTREILR